MKNDMIAERIEAFDTAKGGGVDYYTKQRAYHLYLLDTEAPVARPKPTGDDEDARLGYWSQTQVILPLNDVLEFIANEPIFWTPTFDQETISRLMPHQRYLNIVSQLSTKRSTTFVIVLRGLPHDGLDRAIT